MELYGLVHLNPFLCFSVPFSSVSFLGYYVVHHDSIQQQLKIHGNCPGELPDVIRQLEESTGSIAVDQIGRSVILYRPSSSKMKKREEVARNREEYARNNPRFGKSENAFEERPRNNSAGRRFVKSGSTFRTQQKRRPVASKGSSYSRG